MKFFLPHAKDKKEEDTNYEAIKKFAKEQLGWDISDRRIFSIRYFQLARARLSSKEYYAEVGKILSLNGEEVIAILESNTYLIITPNRGCVRGMPILISKSNAYAVVDFE